MQNMKKVLTSLLFFRGDRSDSVSFIMTWMCRNHTGADTKSHRNNFSMGYNGGGKSKIVVVLSSLNVQVWLHGTKSVDRIVKNRI